MQHVLVFWTRDAPLSLENFSLLRNSDVGWLEECSGGGQRVTAGRAQSRVSSGRNEQNIESWTPWCESDGGRILFVEDDNTLFPSDYSACQVSIKGRTPGCSATLRNRFVCFYYIILVFLFFTVQMIWYKGAFLSVDHLSIFCCPFLILQCRDVWKRSGYLASSFTSALVQPTDLSWAFSYICMTSTFSRQACIAGFWAWRLFVDPPFTFSLLFLLSLLRPLNPLEIKQSPIPET